MVKQNRKVTSSVTQMATPLGMLTRDKSFVMPSKFNRSKFSSIVYYPHHGTGTVDENTLRTFIHEIMNFDKRVEIEFNSLSFINLFGHPVEIHVQNYPLHLTQPGETMTLHSVARDLRITTDKPYLLGVRYQFAFVNQKLELPAFDSAILGQFDLQNQSGFVYAALETFGSKNKPGTGSRTKQRTRKRGRRTRNHAKSVNNPTVEPVQSSSSSKMLNEKHKVKTAKPVVEKRNKVDLGKLSINHVQIAQTEDPYTDVEWNQEQAYGKFTHTAGSVSGHQPKSSGNPARLKTLSLGITQTDDFTSRDYRNDDSSGFIDVINRSPVTPREKVANLIAANNAADIAREKARKNKVLSILSRKS